MTIANILPTTLILGVPSRSLTQQEIKTTGAQLPPGTPNLALVKWAGKELLALMLDTTVAKFLKM